MFLSAEMFNLQRPVLFSAKSLMLQFNIQFRDFSG